MKIFVLVLLLSLLTSCSVENNDAIGKYYSKSKESSIEIRELNDSLLTGMHCIITQSGNRIDCCLGEDGYSINVHKKIPSSYEGVLKSCYDDNEYLIRLDFEENTLKLVFLKDTHSFIKSGTLFFKE